MNYEIRRIRVPLITGQIIEYEAENLCKLIEAKPVVSHMTIPPEVSLDLVVLERWGSVKNPGHKHKIVILKEGEAFHITLPYEPVLSRRGKFYYNADHYLFQL